jgi:hypothetical protein
MHLLSNIRKIYRSKNKNREKLYTWIIKRIKWVLCLPNKRQQQVLLVHLIRMELQPERITALLKVNVTMIHLLKISLSDRFWVR